MSSFFPFKCTDKPVRLANNWYSPSIWCFQTVFSSSRTGESRTRAPTGPRSLDTRDMAVGELWIEPMKSFYKVTRAKRQHGERSSSSDRSEYFFFILILSANRIASAKPPKSASYLHAPILTAPTTLPRLVRHRVKRDYIFCPEFIATPSNERKVLRRTCENQNKPNKVSDFSLEVFGRAFCIQK